MPGSGFVNFQRIFDVNQPQSERQTDALTLGLKKEYNAADTAINDTEAKHLSKIGQIKPLPGTTAAAGPGGTTTPLQTTLPQAPANEYSWEDATKRVGTVQDKANYGAGKGKDKEGNSIGAVAGIQALAQQDQHPAEYSPNMSTWDAALMFGSGAQDKFQGLKQHFDKLSAKLSTSKSKVDNAYAKAMSAVVQTAPQPRQPVVPDPENVHTPLPGTVGVNDEGRRVMEPGTGPLGRDRVVHPPGRAVIEDYEEPAMSTMPALPTMPANDRPGGVYSTPAPVSVPPPAEEPTFDEIFREYGNNRHINWSPP